MTVKLGGLDIKLIRSEFLPERTMVVSPDMYDLLAEGGKAAEAKHQEMLKNIDLISQLVKGKAHG